MGSSFADAKPPNHLVSDIYCFAADLFNWKFKSQPFSLGMDQMRAGYPPMGANVPTSGYRPILSPVMFYEERPTTASPGILKKLGRRKSSASVRFRENISITTNIKFFSAP